MVYLTKHHANTTVDARFVWTSAEYTRSATSFKITFASDTTAAHAAFPSSRPYSVRIPHATPPQSVKVNGKDVAFDRWGAIPMGASRSLPGEGVSSWHFDGADASVVVFTGPMSTSEATTVELTFGSGDECVLC